jgi:hypothetical protein
MIIGTAEVTAVFVSMCLLAKLGRKTVFVGSYALSLVATIGAIVFNYFGEYDLTCLVLETFFLALFRFGMKVNWCTGTIFTSELFPTSVRPIAFGGASFIGRIASLAVPFIITMSEDRGMNPLLPTVLL